MDNPDRTDPNQGHQPPSNEQHNGTKPRRVLCIEDEHFIGELYVRALSRAGYEVKLVYDGQQGLNEALTNAYDIILLDIMIPTLRGTQILQQLRGTDKGPAIKAKIIITTNLEQGDEQREKIEKMADGYIIKAEVTPKELVSFLDNIAI